MPHEHEHLLIVLTCDWLSRAQSDLKAASRLLEGPEPLPVQAAFNAQQAAEKSLKGFLMFNGIDFEKTHDLHELGQQCAGIDNALVEITGRAAPLTAYAVAPRYPGGQLPTAEEARHALEVASQLHEAILAQLPEEVRPQEPQNS